MRSSTKKTSVRQILIQLSGVNLFRGFLRLVTETTAICMRYRVTGLAAEAGFFALLSLPPLILGIVASLGFIGDWLGKQVIDDLRDRVTEFSSAFVTADVVQGVIQPTFDEVVSGGRIGIVSLAFLFSLWSGSRALNVYVDTITIMYGLSGMRGIVRTRAWSFLMYVAAIIVAAIVTPLVLIGPGLLADVLRSWGLLDAASMQFLGAFYWPLLSVLAVVGLSILYTYATPVRTSFRRDMPGALLALIIWYLASLLLRRSIAVSVDGPSIYGPLSAPIVVMIWLYLFAIAVLIGAALNAAINVIYPPDNYPTASIEAVGAGPTGSWAAPEDSASGQGAGPETGLEVPDQSDEPESTQGNTTGAQDALSQAERIIQAVTARVTREGR